MVNVPCGAALAVMSKPPALSFPLPIPKKLAPPFCIAVQIVPVGSDVFTLAMVPTPAAALAILLCTASLVHMASVQDEPYNQPLCRARHRLFAIPPTRPCLSMQMTRYGRTTSTSSRPSPPSSPISIIMSTTPSRSASVSTALNEPMS